MTTDLEAILRDLMDLAPTAREAGIALTWYEPSELRGLDPAKVESVMTLAANEFIGCDAPQTEQQQLPLDMPRNT